MIKQMDELIAAIDAANANLLDGVNRLSNLLVDTPTARIDPRTMVERRTWHGHEVIVDWGRGRAMRRSPETVLYPVRCNSGRDRLNQAIPAPYYATQHWIGNNTTTMV